MPAQGDVARCQRELEALHRKDSEEARKAAAFSQKVAAARAATARASSPSAVRSKTAEVARLERDFAHTQKKRADIAKDVSAATARLHAAQQRLHREQSHEQQALLEIVKREQKAAHEAQARRLVELTTQATLSREATGYDAFISHASEDKEDLVRPLANQLLGAGFRIWFDEFELKVGDSLRRSIDRGLSSSRFGIVVFSPSFFAKNWPQYELDGLVTREMDGAKVILPMWHKVSKDEVIRYSPSLADNVALNTATHTMQQLVEQLSCALSSSRHEEG
jgi:hypothetical protein